MTVPGTEVLIGQTWLKGRLQYCKNPDGTYEAVGYHENGSLKFRYPVQDGEINGVCRSWYEDGALECEEHYRNGVLNGPAHSWYRNGVMEKEESYRKGLWHGTQKRWFPNGVLAFQRVFSGNRRHGPSLEWHSNEKPRLRANYVDDEPHGIFERFDDDGKLVTKDVYVRGVRMPLKKYEKFLSGQLSAEEILSIRNAEVRRIFIEEFGYARILAGMPHTVIDKDGEQELVRIEWGLDEEPICLVKVRCPSTGAFYTLRVPPGQRTVKSAIAWTFDVPAEDYMPEKET
jgi:antitoxin component YwqK of YwqJK toxin-antitoxin module